MKATLSILISALCWSVRLAATEATSHIYTYDPHSEQPNARSRTLSPIAARLVLAQRAGVEEFHSAGLLQEEVLDAINDFGIRTPLFSMGEEKAERAFIILTQSTEEIPSLKDAHSHFTISPAPNVRSTSELVVDLLKQSRAVTAGAKWLVASTAEQFEELWKASVQAGNHITAILTPAGHGQDVGKVDSEWQWGAYRMPHQQSQLRKRQLPDIEEPLEEETSSSHIESSASIPTIFASNDSSSNDPLPGILPSCFTSLSACQSQTRNCTGHGACTKKYTDSTAGESPYANCYVCQCSATIIKNDDGGISTTYWGGPACQKKDVSVQFWLIALFSVAMVALISFAVGTVWTMGDEELPSVIGAGVSGPVKR